jgi:methionyl-tRNA synthetase
MHCRLAPKLTATATDGFQYTVAAGRDEFQNERNNAFRLTRRLPNGPAARRLSSAHDSRNNERLNMTEDNSQAKPAEASAAIPAAQPAETPSGKPIIQYDDFLKLDLRVARVVAAEAHPNADKLVVMQIDMGGGQQRQILAGIRQWSAPETLVGKSIVVVANLAPRKMRGLESNGMLLAATVKEGEEYRDVVIITPDRQVPPGSSVS